MRKRITLILAALIPIGPALAAGCGDYPLSQAQSDYLQSQITDIAIPTGNVPFVQRCDVDDNSIIDRRDLDLIRAARGEAAAHPDDPRDWDGNGIIHGRDVGGCASSCTSKGCSIQDDVAEQEGLETAMEEGSATLPGDTGGCYQIADFDGNATNDFLGIFEYTGNKTRGNNWALEVIILLEDGAGNVHHVEYPYAGQIEDGNGDMLQHLSLHPPGVVDLDPGSLTLTTPGVVSYRNNEPKTIYYLNNGSMSQAFFGIDD
jgi:hypothetical protein